MNPFPLRNWGSRTGEGLRSAVCGPEPSTRVARREIIFLWPQTADCRPPSTFSSYEAGVMRLASHAPRSHSLVGSTLYSRSRYSK